MTPFVDSVLALLPMIPDVGDLEAAKMAISDLEKQGWTKMEAYMLVRNMEEVDASIPEDVAIRRMKIVHRQVEARILAEQGN